MAPTKYPLSLSLAVMPMLNVMNLLKLVSATNRLDECSW